MKVIATDGDQENTVNSMIQYSIVQQSSTAGMFRIDSRTGEILVLQNTLDREVSQWTNLKYFFCCLVKLVSLSPRIHFPTVVIFRKYIIPFTLSLYK